METYQFVMAELCGTWLTAWFREEKEVNGKKFFLVEFADDSDGRWVNEIRPLQLPIR